jgi:hypothetical protein
MRRAAGVYWRPICTGVGFGLLAGLVGMVQWVMTQLDLIEREAAFNAFLQTHPDAWDADTVLWGNHVYWFCSAAVAGFAMLVLYLCAAFTAARASQRVQAGIAAAWLAAAVSMAMYGLATVVAIATSSDPLITSDLVLCEPVLGLGLIVLVTPLAIGVAAWGVSASGALPFGRRAV